MRERALSKEDPEESKTKYLDNDYPSSRDCDWGYSPGHTMYGNEGKYQDSLLNNYDTYKEYEELKPGELQIKIIIPIKNCGNVANPDHDEYDEPTMLLVAEEKAKLIAMSYLQQGIEHRFTFSCTSIEGLDDIEVDIKLTPKN